MGLDYKNGKIYKIISDETDDVYYGSTCDLLSKRLSGHRGSYKSYLKGNGAKSTSFDIVKFESSKIVLVEKFPCDDKTELFKRERHYIELNECVNKFIPGRTSKEYAAYYYKKNKVLINEKRITKNPPVPRKNKVKEYYRQYFKDNPNELIN